MCAFSEDSRRFLSATTGATQLEKKRDGEGKAGEGGKPWTSLFFSLFFRGLPKEVVCADVRTWAHS